jgi:hypothetical protein
MRRNTQFSHGSTALKNWQKLSPGICQFFLRRTLHFLTACHFWEVTKRGDLGHSRTRKKNMHILTNKWFLLIIGVVLGAYFVGPYLNKSNQS